MITKPFEQVEVGERRVTRARTITETDIVNFAMLTGDWHPLHTDVEHAKDSAYGERIAHGMLVLSVMTGLVELDAGHVLAFYGMNRVRFVRPTKIGDTIHAVTEVKETRERGERSGIVTLDVTIENQRNETVASATVLMVVAREASGRQAVEEIV